MRIVILETLSRMFHDVRSIDWTMLVVEALVLLLIAYEVGHGVWRKFILGRRTKSLLSLIIGGMALLERARNGSVTEDNVGARQELVDTWTRETMNELARHSARAAYSVEHITSRLL
jgi:hypothetical protein